MTRHPSWALLGTFALALGCRAAEEQAAPTEAAATVDRGTTAQTRDQVDDDGVVRRGAALSDAEAITVATALGQADELDGQQVKLTGEVDAVCSKKGCWMSLASEDGVSVRVTFKDYGFFVPGKSPGMTATVEGELAVKILDVETAQHYEDDRVDGTGETAKTITEPQRELSIVAAGVELRQS